MFAQLLKIIFIAIIIYALVSLVRFLVGIGRAVNVERAKAEEQARRNVREDGPRMRRDGRGTIELDKDQYKVE
ncbi:MAG TPA: hypothetical protein PLM53_17155 [Spirochaetota bacterium]|nr:hypothetical protein [Spirochaetota bacterium]HPC42989.1 hypothetical protein [Spirochaetota bacterium]HPL18702.1 hypothetical protein [Spirochaetota bacterium]HQF10088.1 hypothetical protein [Spirochaetota bacterium]HQH98828.1 hypothetical protein [Spirochaetota bacterium]